VACGYFDLVTPFAAAEHSFKRLRVPLKENPVTFHYYEGGHMFYTNPQALKKFKSDLTQFFSESTLTRS
jgi:carboxypeptidase C (cathepsin A)